jgi:hypothetical protein
VAVAAPGPAPGTNPAGEGNHVRQRRASGSFSRQEGGGSGGRGSEGAWPAAGRSRTLRRYSRTRRARLTLPSPLHRGRARRRAWREVGSRKQSLALWSLPPGLFRPLQNIAYRGGHSGAELRDPWPCSQPGAGFLRLLGPSPRPAWSPPLAVLLPSQVTEMVTSAP